MRQIKNLIISLIILSSTSLSIAQEITGQWGGTLSAQGIQLNVIFNFLENDNGYSATMDSPDQGVRDIPVSITYKDSTIDLEIPASGISYRGVYKDSLIVGTFIQNNQEFPLNLTKQPNEERVKTRPQEPVKPYPYRSENVSFENQKANITLAGTLTLPQNEGKYAVVILISGSGPQNRDEELMGHKPFLVLSDYLTRNGIAVLRFDDRGFGDSTGDFSAATTADFATDVESAITYLKSRKEIDKSNIGLIGHSEGGLIAPMVATKSQDVDYIVLMAGSGIRGDKLLLLQEELIERALGTTEAEINNLLHTNAKIFDHIVNSKDDTTLNSKLRESLEASLDSDSAVKIPDGMPKKDFITAQIIQFTSPWVKYFLRYNPSETLQNVKCPVLAIIGEKDLQVPPSENLIAIKEALKKGGNHKVTVKEFKDLNHLFQEAETGSPMEYQVIEQTIAPVVLKEITAWIKLQTK